MRSLPGLAVALLSLPLLHCASSAPKSTGVNASGDSPGSAGWSVGLYTDSSFAKFQSEQAALASAGASTSLGLYLNYGDFANFENPSSSGQGIVDVDALNQSGVELVLAFEPTNASFCTHASTTTGNASGGCRLSELNGSSDFAVPAANAYAHIAALADALSQPLILRFASEMNANWDDWDYGLDPAGNSPRAFIEAFAFAHHYITKNLHTGRVLFVFAPNNHSYDGSDFSADIHAFWPGSANVDIIGMDGYSVSGSFQSDFNAQLGELESLGSQPLMLAEFAASTSVPGGREAWLDAAAQDLTNNHPRLAYMNWFDSDKSHPYELTDTDGTGQSLYGHFGSDLLGGAASSP